MNPTVGEERSLDPEPVTLTGPKERPLAVAIQQVVYFIDAPTNEFQSRIQGYLPKCVG